MNFTQFLAWVGAITGSLALGWDVYKWFQTGPKIKIVVAPNMSAYGGLQYSIGTDRKIMVEVTNLGDRPTTLTHLIGYQYASPLHRITRLKALRTIIVQDAQTGPIPQKIHPGDRWLGAVNQNDQIMSLSNKGALYIGVICNHTKRPTLKRVLIK